MTINELSSLFRGKPIADFSMGDSPAGGDVVYRLVQDYDSAESQRELLDSLLDQIDPNRLEALVIGAWSEAQESSPSGYLERLIERRAELPALTALFVGDMTYEDCEISWIIQTSYNGLLDAFPQLQSLRIRGASELELEPFQHSNLQELAIETGGLPSVIVDAIASSSLPALRHLELWLGELNYGYDGNVETYQRLLAAIGPERLSYLGLRNAPHGDDFALWLAQAPWLSKLDTLDLSLGTIGDIGARALFESPHVRELARLDLSHHYISPEWQQKLSTLPIEVLLGDPREEEEDERYVAVSE
jgi:hypothetical protein